MDKNIIILIVLVFIYAVSKYVADKIQVNDCYEQLELIAGAGNMDKQACCECALETVKVSKFKILDEQIKTNGISSLIKVDDPLLDTFDEEWSACVKNKMTTPFAFATSTIDSLNTVCQKEYRETVFEKEVDLDVFCRCYVTTIQKDISVRDLLRKEIDFLNDRAVNDLCAAQSKIVIDTIQ